jgi:hypothetical protein
LARQFPERRIDGLRFDVNVDGGGLLRDCDVEGTHGCNSNRAPYDKA